MKAPSTGEGLNECQVFFPSNAAQAEAVRRCETSRTHTSMYVYWGGGKRRQLQNSGADEHFPGFHTRVKLY